MQIKNELRKKAQEKRKLINNKDELDSLIENRLVNLDLFQNAKTVLIYVSLDDEITTDGIIKIALNKGKTVAVPYCKDKNGAMDFYIINSLSQLNIGSFGIREPNVNNCVLLTDYNDAVIIVPGLLFDKKGNRIGFGKGFYDRYLAKNKILSIGLCYDEMIIDYVPVDKYDVNVDIIVTQSGIINCA